MRKIKVDLCALRQVISYLEYDEKKDYETYERKPKDHIWLSIKKLKANIEN